MPETPLEHPEHIGPYRIRRVIGEGGMGIVYEAEQREPVRRVVAVKMMKVGMDTKQVVARFEAERQALAVMEHPGIATVLDAGATETGRPYFVMELVRGDPIDEHCDRQRLTTRERVELFIKVCESVQHAHQKGVIHRDLKPSNVLVVEEGGRRQPKVIDFGIAKATGQRLTEKTVVTTYGQAVGTLAYMSPEQAELSGLDVDTRTDVYSLGVILYELLVGCVPVDPNELGGHAFLAFLHEPHVTVPTPSGRLTRLSPEARDELSRLRRTDPRSLRRAIAGDLQWIVLKAMEKERGRRYETVNGLARDLERYLSDQPISARPPTTRYRMGKFVRRHRVPVAAAAALALAVLLGLVGTTAGLLRARAAEARAEEEAATAEAALQFMIGMFGGSDPSQGGSAETTAREVLDASIARIDTLQDQPLVQGRLLQAMGGVYTTLGLYDQADTLLRRALEVRRGAAGDEADGALERSVRQLAWLYLNEGRVGEALELARESWRLAELAYPPNSAILADAAQVIGMAYRAQAEYDEARRYLDRSLAIREELFGPDHIQSAFSMYHIAWLENLRMNRAAAREIYERILPVYRAEYGDDHVGYALVLSDYAAVLSTEPATADSALTLYDRVLDVRTRSFGPDHPAVGQTLMNVGVVLQREGHVERASEHYRRALEVYERAYAPESYETALVLSNIGAASAELGDLAGAEEAYRSALDVAEAVLGPEHPFVRTTLRELAAVLHEAGQPEEAARLEARAAAGGS